MNKMYVVALNGCYRDGEGDHTICLYTTKEAAKKRFDEIVEEVKGNYPHVESSWETDDEFLIEDYSNGDVVSVLMSEIVPDGSGINKIF